MPNRYRASVGKDENVLGTDGGGACRTMWMYLMPQNCRLKMVNFMILYLYLSVYIIIFIYTQLLFINTIKICTQKNR